MRVINLYGGPGSGKSTIASGLFYKMKIAGYNVELVTEFARDLINSGSHHMLNDQNWILAHQNDRLSRLKESVDWVITDSPLMLISIYADNVWPDKSYLEIFKLFVKELYYEYHNYNFFIKRPDLGFSDQGRVHDIEESSVIDSRIKCMLDFYKIPYLSVKANEKTQDKLFKLVEVYHKE